ncbi:hypothetical protein DFO67_11577 [Modicisalibacter xianhensis]|uniref:Uncharacterized protein n=1 Tax=Modicisalibacter xianhensis TaxID=442341 RepID=A0A4R8FN28_9GAMM|nr:hypothetical protein [Halomonas xianhensis]TDX26812.1 hypothetical protein DFO67_11577 [Halomonas xianhensis]
MSNVGQTQGMFLKDGYEVVEMTSTAAHKDFSSQVRKRTRRHASLVDLLSFDWPDARKIMNNLYSHISDNIQINKKPVIYNIIDVALDRYHDAVFQKNGRKLDDPKRIAIFIVTLIVETCRELEVAIVDEKGNEWTVDAGQPFIAWREDHPGDLKVYGRSHPDEEMLRKVLYTLVTSESIKGVLKRAGYEEAVLAGCVAPGR